MSASTSIKSLHKKSGHGLRLKQFARDLLKEGSELAKTWFDNKQEFCQKREQDAKFKNKGAKMAEIRQATKTAKRKKKNASGNNE